MNCRLSNELIDMKNQMIEKVVELQKLRDEMHKETKKNAESMKRNVELEASVKDLQNKLEASTLTNNLINLSDNGK